MDSFVKQTTLADIYALLIQAIYNQLLSQNRYIDAGHPKGTPFSTDSTMLNNTDKASYSVVIDFPRHYITPNNPKLNQYELEKQFATYFYAHHSKETILLNNVRIESPINSHEQIYNKHWNQKVYALKHNAIVPLNLILLPFYAADNVFQYGKKLLDERFKDEYQDTLTAYITVRYPQQFSIAPQNISTQGLPAPQDYARY